MQRPSQYKRHNMSLDNFAKIFNNEPYYPNIIIKPIEEETYRDDGLIYEVNTQKSIGFDWEIRDRYFSNGNFYLPTLRQFERKVIKPEIDLSIQCDSTETAIVVAWHEDFKSGNSFVQESKTDYIYKETAIVRETSYFRVYTYEQVVEFKAMLHQAFTNNQYNHNSFK